ncbi:MAG: endopeptidase La [Solirubrobacterales bacterium]|mgnify:FL=1|nr:endopeptidase La [Solirubrobacterales bacterium]OJU94813.1 MAG: endopeptidase La [Solirubrobacterales bacterium 67-14]
MDLLLVPLDEAIVFPSVTATLQIDVGDEEQVFLLPRREGEFARVGVIADVVEKGQSPRGDTVATLVGLRRGLAGVAHADELDPEALRIEVQEIHDGHPEDEHTKELVREYRAIVEEILELRNADSRITAFLRNVSEPGELADTSGLSPDLSFEQKFELLDTLNVTARLEKAVEFQRERLTELQVRSKIRDDVESGAQQQQREYFLREQMKSIRKELGDDDASLIEEYEEKIAEAGMPEAVEEQAEKELRRLERQGEQSGESSMIRSYLDWLIAVPWSKRSEEKLDPDYTREVLDADHAGLDDVKRRITEFVAVRKLRQEREAEADSRADGAILTLVGPPGTGKTSIGESVAKALGREFVRISLGGVHDEAEIRGHRRTYIGSMPGRIVRALRDAETMNPVILLDEVDKVGADWRGDPSAALLEVLDPAQNHSFRDHYLDVEVDLSQVVFLATANMLDTIPAPLLDRMEIIPFDGYTVEEKRAIARDYLLPRQVKRNGLAEGEVEVEDAVLADLIAEYTREAGVRQLEREVGKLMRRAATRIASGEAETPVKVDEEFLREALGKQKFWQESVERTAIPGVSTGLAVTGTGGDVLFIEATAMDGEKGMVLTGQLGDVMKESARIALSYVRSHREQLGIEADAFDREFHLHVPAGAIPKDGPSAGTAMTTALVSLLTGRPVKHTVGMTGEVTLQGRVLPIGGLKQKVLAAHAAGLTDVFLPFRNKADLDDVPEEVREAMTFHPVSSVEEVIDLALEPAGSTADVASM